MDLIPDNRNIMDSPQKSLNFGLSQSSLSIKTSSPKSSDQYWTKNSPENLYSYHSLKEIMSTPILLKYFEEFLVEGMAHELLLFVEALSELKHETDDDMVDFGVQRVFKMFILVGSLLEINVQEDNRNRLIRNFEECRASWCLIRKQDLAVLFKDIELEVMSMLEYKTFAFADWLANRVIEPVRKSIPMKTQKRVVVIGGGFTGFTVCSILDHMARFHVTLIDQKDAFEYTPGMIKMIVRPQDVSPLCVPHDQYVKNGSVIIGNAERIVDGKYVVVGAERIFYDYLVIATGSSYTSKLAIKSSPSISTIYRMKEIMAEHHDLVKAQNILIVGGGLVGCELASEIAHASFPSQYHKKNITLIESHGSLVKRSNKKLQNKALEYLKNLGINIVLRERIIDIDLEHNRYIGASGVVYEGFDKVFVATGTKPESRILLDDGADEGFEGCVDSWRRIKVRDTLQLEHWKYTNIFVGGDVAAVSGEFTAYRAVLAGVAIARNITRIEKGKKPLAQGKGGTLKATVPLHGSAACGGIGKIKLPFIKKTFAFLNREWSALKDFDEQQFLKIVQGEAYMSSLAFGRIPKKLGLLRTSDMESLSSPVSNEIALLFDRDMKGVDDTLVNYVQDSETPETTSSISSNSDDF